MTAVQRAALLSERLQAAAIPLEVWYSNPYKYNVGVLGTHGATTMVDRPTGAAIPYFTCSNLTFSEAEAVVAGLRIAYMITGKDGAR